MRTLSALEINHLIKHGKWPIEIDLLSDQPVEYFTGLAEFRGLDFIVNESTLIPRIETEELVDHVTNYCLRHFSGDETIHLADIGTGSGCIGITVANELFSREKSLQIMLSDISHEALKVAKQNILKFIDSANQAQVITLQSDLLLDYPDSIKIDVIVANLPYIPSQRIDQLDSSVINYEPVSALDGGDKGLSLIKQLVGQAEKLPQVPRAIFLEIDEFVTVDDFDFVTKYHVNLIKDQFEKIRFAQLEKSVSDGI